MSSSKDLINKFLKKELTEIEWEQFEELIAKDSTFIEEVNIASTIQAIENVQMRRELETLYPVLKKKINKKPYKLLSFSKLVKMAAVVILGITFSIISFWVYQFETKPEFAKKPDATIGIYSRSSSGASHVPPQNHPLIQAYDDEKYEKILQELTTITALTSDTLHFIYAMSLYSEQDFTNATQQFDIFLDGIKNKPRNRTFYDQAVLYAAYAYAYAYLYDVENKEQKIARIEELFREVYSNQEPVIPKNKQQEINTQLAKRDNLYYRLARKFSAL